MDRTCFFCKQTKPFTAYAGGKSKYCLECKELLPDCFSKITSRMRHRAIHRDKHKVTITHYDICEIWPRDNKCPVMGTKFVVGEPRQNSPSLDRIDPNKGYEPGNIQIICDLANKMKQNATKEQLERFCKYYGQNDSAASSQGCS